MNGAGVFLLKPRIYLPRARHWNISWFTSRLVDLDIQRDPFAGNKFSILRFGIKFIRLLFGRVLSASAR